MYKTIKGDLRGDRIILEEIIPFSKEQSVLLTIMDRPSAEKKN